jgi:O-antigen/teichoic acid export membrane protein
MYVVCGIGCVLIFYGRDLLAVWISGETAVRAATPMAILAVGFMASAAFCVPYTLSIASGVTSVPLAANLAAATVYVPALYWLVRLWGIEGAAWAWAGLNTYYLLVVLPLLQRRIPLDPVASWFLRHVLPFVGTALVAIGGSWVAARHFGVEGAWPSAIFLAVGGLVYAGIAFAFLDKSVLGHLKMLRRSLTGFQEVPIA